MSENLPVVHPSEYVDPLDADSVEEAIGTTTTPDGIGMALGNESMEEWIRIEGMDLPNVRR